MDTFIANDGIKVRMPRKVQRHFKNLGHGDGPSMDVEIPGMDSLTLNYIKNFYSYDDDDLPGLMYMVCDPICRDGEFVWKISRAATEFGAEHLMLVCVFALTAHVDIAMKYLGMDLKSLETHAEAFNVLLQTVNRLNGIVV